jgi:transcriptional regulator with XRE-family HTH domain
MSDMTRERHLYNGSKIEARMKELGLSDVKLSKEMRLSRPTIIAIRRGHNAEVENVLAVIARLGLEPSEVFEPTTEAASVAA